MLDYAAADSEVRRVLEERIAQMESKAAKLQVGGGGRAGGGAGCRGGRQADRSLRAAGSVSGFRLRSPSVQCCLLR